MGVSGNNHMSPYCVGSRGTAYLVWVTPASTTLCTCLTTSWTGSTGGLHLMKTTGLRQIRGQNYYWRDDDIPQGVLVWQLATSILRARLSSVR